MNVSPPRSRIDWIAILVIVASMVLYARFTWLDQRPPTDLGHYYANLIDFLRFHERGSDLRTELIDTPYMGMLALLLTVTSASHQTMEIVDGAWLLVLLVGVWRAGRAIGGPVCGLVSVLCVAGYPQTQVMARIHWIHHPEAAALLGALGLSLDTPSLEGKWRKVAMAVLLFLGITIRETGVPFGAPVALIVAVLAWRAGARKTAGLVLLVTAAALAFQAPAMLPYIQQKAANSGQYEMSVDNPFRNFVESMSWLMLQPILLLAVIGLLNHKLRGVALATALLSTVWIAGSSVAVAIFHVGGDNFPLFGGGLALLAGLGAVRWRFLPIPATVGMLGVALFVQGTTVLSERLIRPLQQTLAPYARGGLLNYQRVVWGPITAEMIRPVTQKACGSSERRGGRDCVLLVSRGLFNPSWEDSGTFALFLGGMHDVVALTPQGIWDDRGYSHDGAMRIHGFVDVTCREGIAPSFGGRFEAQEKKVASVRTQIADQTPVARVGDPQACIQTWYSFPDGFDVK